MAEPSLQLGNGNWAGKSDNLLAYHKANNNFYADDLTFARASTGTIVNADGLIEEVPYNKLTYSEQFDNAAWLKIGGAVTANAGVSPNGTTTADRFYIASAANNTRLYANYTFVAQEYTLSIYAKNNGSTDSFRYSFADSGGQTFSPNFTVTNEWQRFEYTFTSAGGSGVVWIVSTASDGVGSEIDLLIWGAQLNSGSTAKTYYPTTTRLNVPRVDYLNNANGSLLLEGQRTNLITQSEDFSDGIWTNSAAATIVNPTANLSPDGTLSGNEFNEGTADARRGVYEDVTVSANTSYTLSVFLKKGTSNYLRLVIANEADSGLDWTAIQVDLSDNSLGSKNGTNNVFTDISSSISNIDYNGYYRVQLTAKHPTATALRVVFGMSDGVAIASSNSTARRDYVGVNKYLYVWGAQLEQGSYPTSIINTSGTTVTRNQDTCATTGLSDVIGQTEGTMFFEGVIYGENSSVNRRIFTISNGTTSTGISIQTPATNSKIEFEVTDGGVAQAFISADNNSLVYGQKFKAAFAYKSNDFVAYINGVQIGTDTSGTVPVCDKLSFDRGNDTSNFEGSANQAQLYKTRLTNTELATLTTI